MADPLGGWDDLEGNGDAEPMSVDIVAAGEAISQNDPLLRDICIQHLEVLSDYKKTRFITVEELGRNISVIPTPMSLFPKHLVDRPIDEWKAVKLAIDRDRFEGATTVFEDPETFYFYPELEVIVSERQVKKYRVVPIKPRADKPPTGLNAYEEGLQFAVFDSVYHFNPKKDRNITPVRS